MRVIIIDKIRSTRKTLKKFLCSNFPEVEIVGKATSVKEAIATLSTTRTDLVLMGVKYTDGNAFQILKACTPYTFQVVFITAHQQYALKALKFHVLDYILKPIHEYELCEAISKALSNARPNEYVHPQKDIKRKDSVQTKKCYRPLSRGPLPLSHLGKHCS